MRENRAIFPCVFYEKLMNLRFNKNITSQILINIFNQQFPLKQFITVIINRLMEMYF